MPPASEALPIGELSRRTGVHIETIRYYERIKMLPAPPRTASGRRVYGLTETQTLAFIRRSRELGFTLDEIRTLLALSTKNGQRGHPLALILARRTPPMPSATRGSAIFRPAHATRAPAAGQ
jgi:DNA-binding transcriptional MerR regulator